MGKIGKILKTPNQEIDKLTYIKLIKKNIIIKTFFSLTKIFLLVGLGLFFHFYLYNNILKNFNYDIIFGFIFGFTILSFLSLLFFFIIFLKINKIFKNIETEIAQTKEWKAKTYLKIFKISKLLISKKTLLKIFEEDPEFEKEHKDLIIYAKDLAKKESILGKKSYVIYNYFFYGWFMEIIIVIIWSFCLIPVFIANINYLIGCLRIKNNTIVSENYKKILIKFWSDNEKLYKSNVKEKALKNQTYLSPANNLDKIYLFKFMRKNIFIWFLFILILLLILVSLWLLLHFYFYHQRPNNNMIYDGLTLTAIILGIILLSLEVYYSLTLVKIWKKISYFEKKKYQQDNNPITLYFDFIHLSKLFFGFKTINNVLKSDKQFPIKHKQLIGLNEALINNKMSHKEDNSNSFNDIYTDSLAIVLLVPLIPFVLIGLIGYLIIYINYRLGWFRFKNTALVSESYQKILFEFLPSRENLHTIFLD